VNNVIVTGGTRGLGLSMALTLAKAGYRVVAIARTEGDAFASASRRYAAQDLDRLHFRPFDLADIAGLAGLVRTLRKEFGPFHGLVNNAGIGTSGLLATMSDARIEHLVRLNVLSPIALTKHVVRSMMSAGGGRIVNVSSIVAFTGYNGLSVYAATKAALIGFTRSLARDVGPLGITVNAVAPGFVDTEMTQGLEGVQRERVVRRSALRRLPESRDVADSVEFLLSDKARNITGTTLTVDAGSTA
jgi:3-oxoacyl-[acyl-carrier protein] reductase